MFVNCSSCKIEDTAAEEPQAVRCAEMSSEMGDVVAQKLMRPDGLGALVKGRTKHYYSGGAFNLIQLLFYIMKQTGPVNLFLTTYSISIDSINALKKKMDDGELLSVKFIIDNRVRSISPKPFDCLVGTFPNSFRCTALHAKVALLWNTEWHVTIVGSQNATHNPKLERGVIFTDPEIFMFDYNTLNDEFDNGST